MGLLVAWRSGGVPERQAALVLTLGHMISAPASSISIEVVMLVDVAVTLALIALSCAYRRWWLIIASGSCLLLLAVHMSVVLDRDIFKRAYTTYRIMPGFLLLAAISLSPLERWLASEPRQKCWFTWRYAPRRAVRRSSQ